MPLNEIEQHPYLDYFIDHHNGSENVPWDKYTKMIIGSFPIYDITNTVFPNTEYRSKNTDLALPFFYGSKSNTFWKRFCDCFFEIPPLDLEGTDLRLALAISALEDNNFILTDVIKKTNRFFIEKGIEKPLSSNDTALFNKKVTADILKQFELNNEIIEWIIKGQNIKSLFFTAQKTTKEGKKQDKSICKWFYELLENNNVALTLLFENSNSIQYRMDNPNKGLSRVITLFFLPTPSSYRTITLGIKKQHPMFLKYLKSAAPDLLIEIQKQLYHQNKIQIDKIKKHREDFIQLWWQKYLVHQDMNFDGSF